MADGAKTSASVRPALRRARRCVSRPCMTISNRFGRHTDSVDNGGGWSSSTASVDYRGVFWFPRTASGRLADYESLRRLRGLFEITRFHSMPGNRYPSEYRLPHGSGCLSSCIGTKTSPLVDPLPVRIVLTSSCNAGRSVVYLMHPRWDDRCPTGFCSFIVRIVSRSPTTANFYFSRSSCPCESTFARRLT